MYVTLDVKDGVVHYHTKWVATNEWSCKELQRQSLCAKGIKEAKC